MTTTVFSSRLVRDRRLVVGAIFALAVLVRGLFWFREGTRVVGDSNRALGGCQILTDGLGTYLVSNHIAYAGFEVPYCLFLSVTGGWIDGWILAQLLLSALGCVLLYETARVLVDETAAIVAGVAMALLWETFRWFIRPQSEMFFTFVVILTLWGLARHHQYPSTTTRFAVLGCFGWLCVTRPFGVPIVAGYLVYDTLPDRYRLGLLFSRRVNVVAALVVGAFWVRLLFTHLGSFISRFWVNGIVVTGKFTYQYTPKHPSDPLLFFVSNAGDVAVMAVLKLLFFFVPVLPEWSVIHNLINAFTLTPLLVGAAVALPRMYRSEPAVARLWVTPLIMIVLTVMATWVAGGMNFRAPAAPILALLTGYAVTTSRWPDTLGTAIGWRP